MFNYTFKLSYYQGNSYVQRTLFNYNESVAFTGFSEVKQKIQGLLDSGYIEILNNTKSTFPIFSLLTIEIVDSEGDERVLNYYIGRDEVEIVDKENESKFLHKIELIDLTKKLEKKCLETICFTQPSDKNSLDTYSLWDCLQRLFKIYELGFDVSGGNPNAHKIIDYIDPSLQSELEKIDAPQQVLSNCTLREAFDTIFKYINAITCVNYEIVEGEGQFVLSCEFYNKTYDLITTQGKESVSQDLSVGDYHSELHNLASNVINENKTNGETLCFPSRNGYANVRPPLDTYQMTDNNFCFITPKPIYVINSFDFHCNLMVYDVLASSTYIINKTNYGLDISPFLVETQQYESLEYDAETLEGLNVDKDKKTKINCITYTYNSRQINLSKSYKGFLWTTHCVLYAIGFSAIKDLEKTDLSDLYEGHDYQVSVTSSSLTGSSITIGFTVDSNHKINATIKVVSSSISDFSALAFRLNYIPITQERIISQKEDTSVVKLATSSFSNQRNQIISIQNIMQNEKSNIERTGNESFFISIRHFALSELYKNGDFTNDGYIITKSEYIYYDEFIIGKYEFTKNYARISEYIGINSEYRPYEIPNNTRVYERNLAYTSYCYVSDGSFYDESITNDIVYNVAMQDIVKSLRSITNNTNNIDGAIINIDNLSSIWNNIVSGKNRLYLATTSDGSGNNLIFNFLFPTNYSAGDMVKYRESKWLSEKIPYTTNGRLTNMTIELVNNNPTLDFYSLPLIKYDYTLDDDKIAIKLENLKVLKDASEVLNFTYTLSFINKSLSDIVIGKDFCYYNNLVNYVDKELYLYGSNEDYDKSDLSVKGTTIVKLDDTNTSITLEDNEVKFRVIRESLPNYKWFAIGNSQYNIFMIATTKNLIQSGIYFTFSDKRVDIKERY